MPSTNQYHQLRQQCLLDSTRPFKARGASVARCEDCQLASFACLCSWRPQMTSACEFVVLMHRDEVFKPTNSGRLIADVLPHKTHVFLWHRTEPEPALLALLNDKNRQCFIVFPSEQAAEPTRQVYSALPASEKITTFILLDATWKQSGRMFNLSRWLDAVPSLSLPETLMRSYAVRKSHQENYLSTLEAAGLCLQLAGEDLQSNIMLDYFALFNQHYLATRGCYTPEISEVHQQMMQWLPGFSVAP